MENTEHKEAVAEVTVDPVKDDIVKNKGMALLSYFSWLVLIPVFAGKKSKFARYHANQGLVLAIVETVYWLGSKIALDILEETNRPMWVLTETILFLCASVFVILALIGIVNVLRGKMNRIPTFGRIRILKEKEIA